MAIRFILLILVALALLACVDPEELTLRGRVDVIVVDGTLTNLAEPQVIRLNRSKADSITGRFGTLPLTKATVEVVEDSSRIIPCHETTDGRYELPGDFRGRVGHAYQLRFMLSDGTRYVSSQQVMQPVPPIADLHLRFSLSSLPDNALEGNFRSGYDVLVDVQDPAGQRNFYRWDWTLFEKQDWCQRCQQGYYMTNQLKMVSSYPNILIYQTLPEPAENCFAAPVPTLFGGAYTQPPLGFINSYVCRTSCWDVIPNATISLFEDSYSNGGRITGRNVGQVPYLTQNPALVEIRQSSLTADAHRYFSLLQEQTQNRGGLADGPPTALLGNVFNQVNQQERLVGYFTAQAVASVRSWLAKKDATGIAYGGVYYDPDKKLSLPVPGDEQLYFALNRMRPLTESYLNFTILGGSSRPPTALCVPSDSRTPTKPDGWRD